MRALAFLGKLCNVRSGEWPRLSLLYCMSLAVLIGLTWLDAIIQAAFLQRVGVQYLPWVFISSAAFSFGALCIYTGFADRVPNTNLLIAILAIGGAGLLIGLALVAIGFIALGYLLMFLSLNVPLFNLYSLHWATYVNDFYDIRSAKRIVPVLGTASRLAGIIGGLSVPLLNRLLSPTAIVMAGVGTLAVMAVLSLAMPALLRERSAGSCARPRSRQDQASHASGVRNSLWNVARAYGDNLREAYVQFVRSTFLRWMALATLFMTVLMVLLNYQASAIFQAELQTTVQISNFLGVLSGISNLVVLPIQLFLLSRLIASVGLGNATLVYPLISLAMACSMIVLPGLPAAAFASLDRSSLRTAFWYPIENLLYNAVPLRVKARARAFASGLLVPVGTIMAGLLLLTPLTGTWLLPAAILALALAFLLAALSVRRYYGPALVALLEQEDYSSLTLQAPSLQTPAALPAADPATVARLDQKLRASSSPEHAVFMARLILEIGGDAAVPIVAQAASDATDGRLRASLVDALVAADVRGRGARDLYAQSLADRDGQVRLAAIAGLEHIDGLGDRRYLEVAVRCLADPEVAVRLAVLPALLAAGDQDCRDAGRAALLGLLNAPDPRTRARALQVVGLTHASTFLPEVLRSLADSADEVRLAAALVAEKLAVNGLLAAEREMLLAPALAQLQDPIERARVAVITVLSQLSRESGRAVPDMRAGLAASPARPSRESEAGGNDGHAAVAGLVTALADSSLEVRERAADALALAGRYAIPEVQEQLTATDPQARKMAAVVLARIDPPKYAPLVRGPCLQDALCAIYRNLGCWQPLAGCTGPAVAVLGRALHERNAALLDDFFYLLATIHDPAAVKTIAQALRSRQPSLCASAAEALETMTAPWIAALVAPLFEPDLPPDQLLSLVGQTCHLSIPTAAAALRLFLGEGADAWLRALAAAALAELSARPGVLSPEEIADLLCLARADPDAGVRAEVKGAEAGGPLSHVRKLIFVKEVPFFQGMTIDQLRALASACEEEQCAEGEYIFDEGDAGGEFYIVVDGRVAVEQETRTRSARLASVEAQSYFGESELFDNSPRATAALALQDTLMLRLRREPLIHLARRYPDISLELINVLAQRLRQANDQVAGLARSRPPKLHRLFDSMKE